MHRVILLNGVAVLFARLSDSAENEDKSFVVGATGVVMATHIQVGDFEPKIQVNVVLLAPFESVVLFASGAGHDQELVVKAAYGVTVTGVLHVIH